MGRYRHDTVIAIGYIYDPGDAAELRRAIDALRAEMRDDHGNDESQLLVGPVPTPVNAYVCYAYLPDGSKEGWGTSDRHEAWRERFRALLDATEAFEVLSMEFGGDDADVLSGDVTTCGQVEAVATSRRSRA